MKKEKTTEIYHAYALEDIISGDLKEMVKRFKGIEEDLHSLYPVVERFIYKTESWCDSPTELIITGAWLETDEEYSKRLTRSRIAKEAKKKGDETKKRKKEEVEKRQLKALKLKYETP